jgi:hypothetical protein
MGVAEGEGPGWGVRVFEMFKGPEMSSSLETESWRFCLVGEELVVLAGSGEKLPGGRGVDREEGCMPVKPV